MSLKYSLALNLGALGNHQELQWRVRNGVGCRLGQQEFLAQLA